MRLQQITLAMLLPLLFLGCEKDDPDPCAGVVCRNAGTCVNGVCDCPEGYTGPDCGTEIPPSSVSITSVVVEEFPSTRPNGGGWDDTTFPDLYIRVVDNTGEVCRSVTLDDRQFDQAYTIPIDCVIENVNQQHAIRLFDDDGPILSHDFMGEVYYTPYTAGEGFPETVELVFNGLEVEVYLEYTY